MVYVYIYIYIYMCVCVCVCVYVYIVERRGIGDFGRASRPHGSLPANGP